MKEECLSKLILFGEGSLRPALIGTMQAIAFMRPEVDEVPSAGTIRGSRDAAYREAKATGFDGGTRSACIMRYPGRIKAGSTSTKALCSVDLGPTFAHLARAIRLLRLWAGETERSIPV